MTRQEKYPNTSTFMYHNENPKNRITSDCTVRAIARATKIPYNQVVMEMAQLQLETGYNAYGSKCIELYLKQKGWTKQKQMRKSNNTKYTGKEFCKVIKQDRVIANIGGHHIVAIINGKVNDIWDSTDGCVGNYWIKEEA